MATDWEPKLSEEELLQLVSLDLKDTEKQVEDLCAAMSANTRVDMVTRVGSAVFGMACFVPARSHVLLAAVAMEMLNRERGKYA